MILIYGKTDCPFCDKAKELCEDIGVEYKYYSIDDPKGKNRKKMFDMNPDAKTVPQIWWKPPFGSYRGKTYIGGYDDLVDWSNPNKGEKK